MKQLLYLAINSNGTARVTKTRSQLKFDEVEIALKLDIPDALFEKPRLEATVVVPKEAINPLQIECDVADNIAEAVNQATGMPVHITITRPENE